MSRSTASSVGLPTRLERAPGLSRTLVRGQARQVLRRCGAVKEQQRQRASAAQYSPHQFADQQMQPDVFPEVVQVLFPGAPPQLPVTTEYDALTQEEFFQRVRLRLPALGAPLWQAHQHNMRARARGGHLVDVCQLADRLDQIRCGACGYAAPRRKWDRLRHGPCFAAASRQYHTHWTTVLRSMPRAVDKLRQPAPD